jgi:5-enolpyruvylshikimate-3-phosphate synthase
MAEGLSQLGIENRVQPDGIEVVGGEMTGGVITTHHDHRIAMSFAMAALRASDRIKVSDCAHVATSFPGFAALAVQTGLRLEAAEE